MPRFVLLYHDCPAEFPRPSHWDLMLEQEGMLRTWALAELPQAWQPLVERTEEACRTSCPAASGANVIAAEALGDHRPDYLDYEGPVSDERGEVTRVESGTFETERATPDRWIVTVDGQILAGRMTLNRLSPSGTGWQLTYWPAGGAA
jgi:hypothetical protein